MFTKQQIEDYVKSKGLACPYCGSVGHISINGRLICDGEHWEVNQPMLCRLCKREWYETFLLSTISEIQSDAPAVVIPKVDSCDCSPSSK